MLLKVSSEEETTHHLFIANRCNKPTGRHHVLHMFPKIRTVKFVSSRKLPDNRAGTAWKPEETVLIIRKHLVVLSRRIIKFSMRKTNLVRSIVMQSWYSAFILGGFEASQRRTELRNKR